MRRQLRRTWTFEILHFHWYLVALAPPSECQRAFWSWSDWVQPLHGVWRQWILVQHPGQCLNRQHCGQAGQSQTLGSFWLLQPGGCSKLTWSKMQLNFKKWQNCKRRTSNAYFWFSPLPLAFLPPQTWSNCTKLGHPQYLISILCKLDHQSIRPVVDNDRRNNSHQRPDGIEEPCPISLLTGSKLLKLDWNLTYDEINIKPVEPKTTCETLNRSGGKSGSL